MAEARGDILARIRGALADRPAREPIPRDYWHARPIADRHALFAERVAHYRAAVHPVSATEVSGMLDSLFAEAGARRIVAPVDLPERWLTPNVPCVHDDPPLAISTLDESDAVVTGCAVAIAETGTIVLDGTGQQGRRMLTLVPDWHVCVVGGEQVVGSVGEAVAWLDPVRPLTFISGPSATSDIELDRVEGVHGPRRLDVLLVSE